MSHIDTYTTMQNTQAARRSIFDRLFQHYDFHASVECVNGVQHDIQDESALIQTVFLASGQAGEPSRAVTFRVRFDALGNVIEAGARDRSTGEDVGHLPDPDISPAITSAMVVAKRSDIHAAAFLHQRTEELRTRLEDAAKLILDDLLSRIPTATGEAPMVVPAWAYSDDRVVEVEFDAAPWLTQADDQEIIDLMDCGWGGDYPADAVAEHFGDVEPVASLFLYLGQVQKAKTIGFECRVDEEAATAWLATHRPALAAQLVDGDDVAEWVGTHYRHNFDAMSEAQQQDWRERYVQMHWRVASSTSAG